MLYTGRATSSCWISGLDSGARGYALKEGTPSELTAALEHGRRRRHLRGPAAASGAAVAARRPSGMPSLSKREREIMDLLAQGLTGEQVAEKLVLSSETVKTHIRNAMSKLEASTRVHAIAIALREGFIQPPRRAQGSTTRADDERAAAGCATTCACCSTIVSGFAEVLAGRPGDLRRRPARVRLPHPRRRLIQIGELVDTVARGALGELGRSRAHPT